MTKRIVQFAMVASWAFYALAIGLAWGGEVLGSRGAVLDLFDFQPGAEHAPMWLLASGFVLACAMLASLGLAYVAVWQILNAGPQQRFDTLGQRLQKLGAGLVGLWVFWNLVTGVFQLALADYATPETAAEYEWNPFDIDIVLPIVGAAIFLIARMMQRASQAEEENSQFM